MNNKQFSFNSHIRVNFTQKKLATNKWREKYYPEVLSKNIFIQISATLYHTNDATPLWIKERKVFWLHFFVLKRDLLLRIDQSWFFVSSLLWEIVSSIDTHYNHRRKVNPYNSLLFINSDPVRYNFGQKKDDKK